MSKRKHGLGLLGLLAITALGMMAFASMAQAATPRFLVGGTLAPTGKTTVLGEQEGRGTLSIPGLNTEINCEKAKVLLGVILSSVDADASILYEECSVLENKSPLAELPCHVSDVHTGNPSVLHITALNALLLPIEFTDGSFGALVENISVFINFLSGTGCPLPLKTEVKGTVCAKITAATNNTKAPLAQFSEAIQKAGGCADKLLFGAQESFITGNAKLFLEGEAKTLGVSLD